jgi:hypothetical protein
MDGADGAPLPAAADAAWPVRSTDHRDAITCLASYILMVLIIGDAEDR